MHFQPSEHSEYGWWPFSDASKPAVSAEQKEAEAQVKSVIASQSVGVITVTSTEDFRRLGQAVLASIKAEARISLADPTVPLANVINPALKVKVDELGPYFDKLKAIAEMYECPQTAKAIVEAKRIWAKLNGKDDSPDWIMPAALCGLGVIGALGGYYYFYIRPQSR